MQKSVSGFTIIELIVIIVVVGIIAAIVTVSYNSFQVSITHEGRLTELRGWRASYEKYRAAHGEYPYPEENGIYCLGTGFPNGRCAISTSAPYVNASEEGSAALMSMLAPYDPPATGPRTEVPYSGTTPPYVQYITSTIYLNTILYLEGTEYPKCPADIPQSGSASGAYGGQEYRRVTCQFVLTSW